MLDKANERAILAEHGRWIARLRDVTRLFDQRLSMLERRISIFEGHISELVKMNNKLDARLTSATDRLSVLNSRLEVLAQRLLELEKLRASPRAPKTENFK